MSGWDDFDEEDGESISSLLKNDDVSFFDIIAADTVLQELRIDNDDLREYLSRAENIKLLCEWSMSTIHEEEGTGPDGVDFIVRSKQCTDLLYCRCEFQDVLIESEEFIAFMNSRLDGADDQDSYTEGHFELVFMGILEDHKDFLGKFEEPIKKLARRIDHPAVANMIKRIIVSQNPVNGIKDLIETAQDKPSHLISTIEGIYSGLEHSGTDADVVFKPEDIEEFAKIQAEGLDNTRKMHFLSHFPVDGEVPQKAETAVEAFSVLSKNPPLSTLVQFIVNGNSHWILASKVYNKLEKCPQEEFNAAVTSEVISTLAALESPPTRQQVAFAYLVDNRAVDAIKSSQEFKAVKERYGERLTNYKKQFGGSYED